MGGASHRGRLRERLRTWRRMAPSTLPRPTRSDASRLWRPARTPTRHRPRGPRKGSCGLARQPRRHRPRATATAGRLRCRQQRALGATPAPTQPDSSTARSLLHPRRWAWAVRCQPTTGRPRWGKVNLWAAIVTHTTLTHHPLAPIRTPPAQVPPAWPPSCSRQACQRPRPTATAP